MYIYIYVYIYSIIPPCYLLEHSLDDRHIKSITAHHVLKQQTRCCKAIVVINRRTNYIHLASVRLEQFVCCRSLIVTYYLRTYDKIIGLHGPDRKIFKQ